MKKEIIKTEIYSFEDFLRLIALSNPSLPIHVIFKAKKLSKEVFYIYYDRGNELIYHISKNQTNENENLFFEIEPETLKIRKIKYNDNFKFCPTKKYIYVSNVKTTNLLDCVEI